MLASAQEKSPLRSPMSAPEVGSELRRKCLSVACEVAARVRDCEKFVNDFQPIGASLGGEWWHWWNAASLAGGHTGAALLFSALERVESKDAWAFAAADHLRLAVQPDRPQVGLHSGLAGILAVARYAANGTKRYQTVRSDVTSLLLEHLTATAPVARIRDVWDFDLIAGFSGVFLALDEIPSIWTHRLRAIFGEEANWRCEMPALPQYGVCNNLGLAHGISGVLASLSVAKKDSALESLASDLLGYLRKSASVDPKSLVWGCAIGIDGHPIPTRFAWCYGTPGTAAVVAHAAVEVGNEEVAREAIVSLQTMGDRSDAEMHLEDNAICHGLAGIALCVHSVGRLCNNRELLEMASEFASRIANEFDESLPFGYRAVTPNGILDDHRFLTGSIGIAVALLTICFEEAGGWQHAVLGLPN